MILRSQRDLILWALRHGQALSPSQIAQRIRSKSPGARAASVELSLFRMEREGLPVGSRKSGRGRRWWRTDTEAPS